MIFLLLSVSASDISLPVGFSQLCSSLCWFQPVIFLLLSVLASDILLTVGFSQSYSSYCISASDIPLTVFQPVIFLFACVFIKPEFLFFYCNVARWCDVSSCPSIQYFSHLYKFIFIIQKDYFLDISKAYNTKNFECSRIPRKIQFRHTFSSAISEGSCSNRSGFIMVQLKTTHEAKRCNIRIYERKQSLVRPRKKDQAK